MDHSAKMVWKALFRGFLHWEAVKDIHLNIFARAEQHHKSQNQNWNISKKENKKMSIKRRLDKEFMVYSHNGTLFNSKN